MDLSRHMNQILEINAKEQWVKVQAGVVKDVLNDALRPFGYFFAPDLSTSNRATVGGMINTDASGQGSLVYGKTSDHILGLTSVLANGDVLATDLRRSQIVSRIHKPVIKPLQRKYKLHVLSSERQYSLNSPRLNRF